MKGDISALQYMRAHGNSPGPTQRPKLVGTVSGLIGSIPGVAILYWSGALGSVGVAIGTNESVTLALIVWASILKGILYAAVFQRAANDFRGGWLFGSSFGFLIWMVGPVTIWQVSTGRALAAGRPAMGLFIAYISYGLVLGAVYPIINRSLQKQLRRNGA